MRKLFVTFSLFLCVVLGEAQTVSFLPGWDPSSGTLPVAGIGYFEGRIPDGEILQGFSLSYATHGFYVSGGLSTDGRIDHLLMGPSFTLSVRSSAGTVFVPLSPLAGACRMGGDGNFDYGIATGLVWDERLRPGFLFTLTRGIVAGALVLTF